MEKIIVNCRCCGEPNEISFKAEDFISWRNGTPIQRAMPYLSADVRELLISGTCPVCWDKMFGE